MRYYEKIVPQSNVTEEFGLITFFFIFYFFVINVFHRGPYGPHSNANVTEEFGTHIACADPETSLLTSFYFYFLYHQHIYTEVRTDLPLETIGPKGPNCFSRGLRTSLSKHKPKAICVFPPVRTPIPPSRYAHAYLPH